MAEDVKKVGQRIGSKLETVKPKTSAPVLFTGHDLFEHICQLHERRSLSLSFCSVMLERTGVVIMESVPDNISPSESESLCDFMLSLAMVALLVGWLVLFASAGSGPQRLFHGCSFIQATTTMAATAASLFASCHTRRVAGGSDLPFEVSSTRLVCLPL